MARLMYPRPSKMLVLKHQALGDPDARLSGGDGRRRIRESLSPESNVKARYEELLGDRA